MGEVKLLDCTLGVGGELNQWRYGEDSIPKLQSLLCKSGVEMVEVGLLRSENRGPHYTIYDSVKLPPIFERRPGQIYGMLLSENQPDICTVPVHSERTVDVIRICVSSKQNLVDWEYYGHLKEKGYQVAVLISETAQYEKGELSALLNQVNTMMPCACYIYDGSGVLSKEELKETFVQYDEVLDSRIAIGFHGCSNLMPAIDLAKAFCGMETPRELWIDASVAGMGTGALHLDTGTAAKWMNTSRKKDYYLPVLDYLEEMISPYVTPKKSAGAKLLYYATAESRCSYRYAEYYSNDLTIDVSDQVEIFKEISKEDAFHFSKQAANRALMAYRKKKLNMVVVIPTANRPAAIDMLLYQAAQDLLRYGIDLVIYDSSKDEKTNAITVNFQIDGYNNVYYKRYTGEFDGLSIDKKVITALEEHLDYDYIWLCRDGLIPTISQFYSELMEFIENETEFIAVDWSNRNSNRHFVRNYDSCVDFFLENAGRMNTLGCSIFKSSFIKKVLQNYPLDESNYGFWIPIAPLHQMAAEPVQAGLIVSNVFMYNLCGSPSSYWVTKMLKAWGENWYRTIMGLPELYNPVKAIVLKVHTEDFHPFTLKSMLTLRSYNGFNLSVYRQYQFILSQISGNPTWKFYFAAVSPKCFAKLLVRIDQYWISHPTSKLSNLIGKIYSIYVRLER